MVRSREAHTLASATASKPGQSSSADATAASNSGQVRNADMTAAFRTADLSVGYDGDPLISDIDLDLEPGTVLALIGPNGAGKSTILKTIAKYLAAIHGVVYINQRSVADMSNRDLARKVAVVLTDRLKPDLMTCYDVVATGRYPHTGRFGVLGDEDKAQVRQAMELLHAWGLRDRDFGQISDGQKQRVLIARALAQEPQIIVLDEPTAYLDVRYKLELLTILRRMAKSRGITVIMSLHELDMAQKIADLVVVVDGKAVAAQGPPSTIFTGGRIDHIFGLTDGSYDPLFGSLEFGVPAGDPEVFVIAGGGSGIATYRALQLRGVCFATGVLHEADIDHHLALRLASQVIAEPAFEPISDASLAAAREAMTACRAVICCLDKFGPLNARNHDLLDEARSVGLPVLTDVSQLDGWS